MKKVAVLFFVLSTALIGCKGHGKAPQVDKWTSCAVDGNRLEDLSLASVARFSDGTVKAFDRTACLAQTIPEGDQWQVWFHDNDGPEWIDSSKAVFVLQRAGGASSPIRYIRAFKNRASAGAFYDRASGLNEIAPDYETLRSVLRQE